MASLRLEPLVHGDEFVLEGGGVLDDAFRRQLTDAIASWHKQNPLETPWRATRDPYRILVSEMLLQRTSYKRVVAVVSLLFDAYPSVDALARAEVEAVEDLLRPLGLFYRGAVVVECARTLVRDFDGRVPEGESDLLSLPGVGNYVARAVRCIAFGHSASAIDGGIARVLRRVVGFDSGREPNYDRDLWRLATWVAQAGTGRDYLFGLLDVARDICRREPRCAECPVRDLCASHD